MLLELMSADTEGRVARPAILTLPVHSSSPALATESRIRNDPSAARLPVATTESSKRMVIPPAAAIVTRTLDVSVSLMPSADNLMVADPA